MPWGVKKIATWLVILVLLAGVTPARAEPLPESAHIDGVPAHAQSYALSCESRSAADWAAYWGVKISEKKFLNSLPRSDNPEQGFVGEPNGVWGGVPPASYGVHAKPVAALLREYGLQAKAQRGMSYDELRLEIAAGRPVIVWVIGQMEAGSPQKYIPTKGKAVTVASFEHTMIVTGYDPAMVHVVDAFTGNRQSYPARTFMASWSTLGRMAVTGSGRAEPAPETAAAPKIAFLPVLILQAAPPAYNVQPGDHLLAVARHLGLDWKQLAELNRLSFPYTLYPGQLLSVPR